MTGNYFTILGSSSGMPQPERACSGYVLQVDEELTLIDCGGGVASAFLNFGFDPLQVKRVFISHTHPDHVSDLPLFIQMVYLAGQKDSLDVFLPEEFVPSFENYIRALYLLPEKLPFRLNINGYQDGYIFKGSFKLAAFGNNHLKGYAPFIEKYNLPNKMQSHSFLIEVAGKSLFYSADVYDFEDIKEYLTGQDYVFIEATHLDFDQFIKYVPQLNIGQYIITHLGNPMEIKELRKKIGDSGLKNIRLAKEGLKIVL